MAALQPGRIGLPEALRTDERAESVLGCLNLINSTSKRTSGNRPGITDDQFRAGRRYGEIVGAYLAQMGIPGSVLQGRGGQGCVGALDCPADTCLCLRRTKSYMRAHEAISACASPQLAHLVHKAVRWVVIDNHPPDADQFEYLKLGLSALARHFGLTNHRKS